MKPDRTFKITVNGEVHELHSSLLLERLDYQRAVNLAGLPPKRRGYYNVCYTYPDKPGLWHQLPGSTHFVDDMYVEVIPPDKRWWEFWK